MRYCLLSDCYYLHWDDAVCAPLAKIDGLSHGANVFTGVSRLCDDTTGQVSFFSTNLHVCLYQQWYHTLIWVRGRYGSSAISACHLSIICDITALSNYYHITLLENPDFLISFLSPFGESLYLCNIEYGNFFLSCWS